ncbi:UNVERIFIED_ORG: putative KAP-like P-loop ATPase [Rahnella aquatilis]
MKMINNEITFEERDEFKRELIAKKIITLLNNNIDISPMVIDGDWGTGKTEFCYKLINLYKAEAKQSKVVYIDAFKEDHSNEPLMTILAAIIQLFPNKQQSELISKALPALRFGVRTIAKASVGWVLKQNADILSEELDTIIKDSSNAAIDVTVQNILKDHINSDKNIKSLQSALSKLSEKNKIIVFIDELDRCRPNFAISILENIKHVFNIPNVKFVLVTNTQQLQAAINKSYGYSINAKKYLEKFIKYSYTLPINYKNEFHEKTQISISYFKKLVSESTLTSQVNEQLFHFTDGLIAKNNLSLREVETFVRYFEIYQSVSKQPLTMRTKFGYLAYTLMSIYLYTFHRELSAEIQSGKINVDIIAKALNYTRISFDDSALRDYPNVLLYGLYTESTTLRSEILDKSTERQRQVIYERISLFFDNQYDSSEQNIKILKSALDVLSLSNDI